MGSKSKASTSSTTTNTQTITTEQRDESFNVSGSEGIIAGGNITYQVTDGGAVSDALDFANEIGADSLRTAERGLEIGAQFGEQALDFVGEFGEAALDANRGVVREAFDFSGGTLDAALDFGSGALGDALAFADAVNRRGQDATDSALRTLGNAIETAGNVTRSDSADTLRVVGIGLAVVLGIGFIAVAMRSK